MDLLKKVNIYFNRRNKLSERMQLLFLKRLYDLLQNGYSLLASLEALTYEPKFVPYVELIVKELLRGATVDEAFQQANFHGSITSYLYFVRLSGDLEDKISRCIRLVEQRISYKNRILSIIRYPVFLLFIFLLILFFVKTFIFPAF